MRTSRASTFKAASVPHQTLRVWGIRRRLVELNVASLSRKQSPSHIIIVAAVLSRAITRELDDDQVFHATGDTAGVDTSDSVEVLQRHRHQRPEFRVEGSRMRAEMASDRSPGGLGRIGSHRRRQLGSRCHQLAPDSLARRPRRLEDLVAANESGGGECQGPEGTCQARPPSASGAADRTALRLV